MATKVLLGIKSLLSAELFHFIRSSKRHESKLVEILPLHFPGRAVG